MTKGIGSGKTNLSGTRGESPVLRVRLPYELLDEVNEKADRTKEPVYIVVRRLLRKWVGK
jgi:hypothetical protein